MKNLMIKGFIQLLSLYSSKTPQACQAWCPMTSRFGKIWHDQESPGIQAVRALKMKITHEKPFPEGHGADTAHTLTCLQNVAV
jgi:hypothetical protein